MNENELIGRLIVMAKYQFSPHTLIADVTREVLRLQREGFLLDEKPCGTVVRSVNGSPLAKGGRG